MASIKIFDGSGLDVVHSHGTLNISDKEFGRLTVHDRTPENKGFVNAVLLATTKSGAFFINTAREAAVAMRAGFSPAHEPCPPRK